MKTRKDKPAARKRTGKPKRGAAAPRRSLSVRIEELTQQALHEAGLDTTDLVSLTAPARARPKVCEPEIVGRQSPRSGWRRALARAAYGVALGAAGVGFSLVGAVLTVTILGAPVGIPLSMIGLGLLMAAFLIAAGAGRRGPQGAPSFAA